MCGAGRSPTMAAVIHLQEESPWPPPAAGGRRRRRRRDQARPAEAPRVGEVPRDDDWKYHVEIMILMLYGLNDCLLFRFAGQQHVADAF